MTDPTYPTVVALLASPLGQGEAVREYAERSSNARGDELYVSDLADAAILAVANEFAEFKKEAWAAGAKRVVCGYLPRWGKHCD